VFASVFFRIFLHALLSWHLPFLCSFFPYFKTGGIREETSECSVR
jgi:hypothetical protein